MSSSHPGLSQLRDLMVADAEFMRDHRGHVVALVAVVMSGPAPAAEATSRATLSVIAELVGAAQEVGEVRADIDPADAAFLMMRTLEGLAMAVVADPGLDPVSRARGMADIICAGLGPMSRPPRAVTSVAAAVGVVVVVVVVVVTSVLAVTSEPWMGLLVGGLAGRAAGCARPSGPVPDTLVADGCGHRSWRRATRRSSPCTWCCCPPVRAAGRR